MQCAAHSSQLPLPSEQQGERPIWEMKPSPGKGRGLFAAKDILKGTHVLVEAPLLIVSPPALVPGMGYSLSAMAADVEHEFSRLSPAQQEEYLSCHEQRLEGDSQDETGRLMAILRSNAYNLEDGRVAIYPKVALINHSCQPNVLNADNGGTRVIVATRDIKEGEEVCRRRLQLVGESHNIYISPRLVSKQLTPHLRADLYNIYTTAHGHKKTQPEASTVRIQLRLRGMPGPDFGHETSSGWQGPRRVRERAANHRHEDEVRKEQAHVYRSSAGRVR